MTKVEQQCFNKLLGVKDLEILELIENTDGTFSLKVYWYENLVISLGTKEILYINDNIETWFRKEDLQDFIDMIDELSSYL